MSGIDPNKMKEWKIGRVWGFIGFSKSLDEFLWKEIQMNKVLRTKHVFGLDIVEPINGIGGHFYNLWLGPLYITWQVLEKGEG